MTVLEFLVVALAVFRVSRLIVSDTILDTPRLWILTRYPASDTVFVDWRDDLFWVEKVGGWMAIKPHLIGELISCVWCTGFWISVIAVAAWWQSPEVAWWLALPFALSAVAGLLEEVTQ